MALFVSACLLVLVSIRFLFLFFESLLCYDPGNRKKVLKQLVYAFKLLRLLYFWIELIYFEVIVFNCFGKLLRAESVGWERLSELSVFVYLLRVFAMSNFVFVCVLICKCYISLSWFWVKCVMD